MRCLLIIPAILLMSISAFAQYTETNFEEFNDLYFRNHSYVDDLGYKDIEGNPYSNVDLVPGNIEFVSGFKKDSIPMRYNWYTKTMEFMPEDEILEMPASKNIKQIELGGEKYIPFFYLSSVGGYLLELYRDDISLFRQNKVQFVDVKPATSGYEETQPAKFQWARPTYIVITDKGDLIRLDQNKKRFANQFPAYKDELKAYIKENKINLKNEEDLKKLIAVINEWEKPGQE